MDKGAGETLQPLLSAVRFAGPERTNTKTTRHLAMARDTVRTGRVHQQGNRNATSQSSRRRYCSAHQPARGTVSSRTCSGYAGRDSDRNQDRPHLAYSGPASGYGVIGKFETAFFNMVNDQGGVAGRKINFISLGDGYSPPKTVEQVRRLVEQDQSRFCSTIWARPPIQRSDTT